jgi:hypothetical protein
MHQLIGDIRYAFRQFRLSPLFHDQRSLDAGFGHWRHHRNLFVDPCVMLRCLPVADPSRLYRIGDGYDVGPTAGPEGTWGLFSMPLYERLKAALPDFEEVTHFRPALGASSLNVPARRLLVGFSKGICHRKLFFGSRRAAVYGAPDQQVR